MTIDEEFLSFVSRQLAVLSSRIRDGRAEIINYEESNGVKSTAIDNAIHRSPDGTVTIKVTFRKNEDY